MPSSRARRSSPTGVDVVDATRSTTFLVALGAGRGLSALSGLATFLAGPWGIVVAAAAFAIGGLALKHYEAKKASEEFVKQLHFENGVLDENSRAATAQKEATGGYIDYPVRPIGEGIRAVLGKLKLTRS